MPSIIFTRTSEYESEARMTRLIMCRFIITQSILKLDYEKIGFKQEKKT